MSWMNKCYARLLIDNHITDQNPAFMEKFSPEEYVRMVRLAGVESSMVYACDHNGNCYYPTRVGHRHGALSGRDFFGDVISGLRRENIVPIAYYTVIYHNHSAITHPEWRQRDANGKQHDRRYHYSCPNHPDYLEFTKAQLTEIIAYDVEGIFIDMTFWPMVCQCESCRRKYLEECGRQIPETIDWHDPEWVRFQRTRERWMAEFAAQLTNFIRERRPDISVTHQFSPVLHGWFLGQSSGIAAASDYASGDFYGGKYQQRLGVKIFSAYSRQQPCEFMTSRCVDLHDHTSTKSEEELFLHSASTLANGGAFLFIDAINPDGTLEERVHRRLGQVVERLRPFTECVRSHQPLSAATCGLYFSMSSCVNQAISGTRLKDLHEAGANNMGMRYNAVIEEIIGTTMVLNRMHIPYRVITDSTTDFGNLNTLIVNNAAYLSHEECDRIRSFVRDGGTLIVTGHSSLYDINGETKGNFQLADVLGVDYSGKDARTGRYMRSDGNELISSSGVNAPLVSASTAQVTGTVELPHFPVNDPDHYASIHSNPPGIASGSAGLTVNNYGKGRCVYLYSSLLKHRQDSQQEFAMSLFRRFITPEITATQNIPGGTELTLLRSGNSRSLLCGLVNYQEESPVTPAYDLKISLQIPPDFHKLNISKVSDGQQIDFSIRDGIATFTLDKLELFEIIVITGE